MDEKKLIIVGASGHGKVILDIALQNGYKVAGFLDDDTSKKELIGYPILGTVSEAFRYAADTRLILAIGSNETRKKLAEMLSAACSDTPIHWATLIHPRAVIGMGVQIGAGTVVMAQAVINPDAQIGEHCIINTSAVVEHDNILEDYVHISPKAALAGTVMVGEGTHIGIGAVVRNNLNICGHCTIGAGAVVVKNIEKPGTYMGVPAERRTEHGKDTDSGQF